MYGTHLVMDLWSVLTSMGQGAFMFFFFFNLQKEDLSVTQNLVDICSKTMKVQANDEIGCIQLVYGLPGLYKVLYTFPLGDLVCHSVKCAVLLS